MSQMSLCCLTSVEVFVQLLHWLHSLCLFKHNNKQQNLLLSDSWSGGTECCWTHLQSSGNDSGRRWHSWQRCCLYSSNQSTPELVLVSVVSSEYCSSSCYNQMWYKTSSLSLQVFSPQMETGPVWSHSRLLEAKKLWSSSSFTQLQKNSSAVSNRFVFLTMKTNYKE